MIFKKTDKLFKDASRSDEERAKLLRVDLQRGAVFGWLLFSMILTLLCSAISGILKIAAMLDGHLPDKESTRRFDLLEVAWIPCLTVAIGALIGLLATDQRVKMLILFNVLKGRSQ